MRVVVFGYHDVGCACLTALLELEQEVQLVVTHHDDPGENVWFGSVAAIASSRGIPVATPEDVNEPSFVESIRRLKPDALLSCYFRQILSRDLIAIPPRGAYNMHGSLLPRYRGRAPVNWVLVRGETVTGVTLHHMTEKADRGDVVGQRSVPITDKDTALTLHGKCAAAAGDLLRELWPLVEAGTAPRIPQDPAKASYYGRRRPEDGRIDWTRSARECWNLVRAVTHPYPGAFTTAGARKVYIWRASLLDAEPGTPQPSEPTQKEAVGHTRQDAPIPASQEAGERESSIQDGRPRVAVPGTIEEIVTGRGFVVATGHERLLVESAQIEGSDEMPAEDLVRRGVLAVGLTLS